MKQSRLLLRLDSAIAKARESLTLHCLQIERACYLARRGQTEEARATVVELRRRYEQNPSALISAWLSLAEGLLIHFSNMGQQARDKIQRAHALSAAAGLRQLNATSAAWLAHMDYLTGNMGAMARYIKEAIELAERGNHSALSRASLVTADALHLAGRMDLAKPWYAKAHEHAIADGDDATVGALMHNMAWLRFANLRQSTFDGGSVSPSGQLALVSVDSTLQFENMVGADGLYALSPILRAQILADKGEFAASLALCDEHLTKAIDQGIQRLQPSLVADQAWCHLNLGQILAARENAEVAEALIDPAGQFDDRASAHSRLAQVFHGLEDASASDRHFEQAKLAWEGHAALQSKIIEILHSPQNNAILNFLR